LISRRAPEALEEAAYAGEFERGRALSLDEAIHLAVNDVAGSTCALFRPPGIRVTAVAVLT
jgi:hypothetical protein